MIPSALNWYNTGVTVELRELVNSGINIWDFDYPSYYKDEEKKEFEQKVIDHFYFRQIGQETPGRWLHYFRTRIREIMPYYLQRYKSVEIMMSQDPLEIYNLKEEYTEETTGTGKVSGSSTGESSSENTSTGDSTKKFSNTPQGEIANIEKFMTEATKEDITDTETATSSASGTSEQSSEDTGSKTYTMTRKGNIGVQPLGQEINVYRSALINVDLEIINELNDLFLAVY